MTRTISDIERMGFIETYDSALMKINNYKKSFLRKDLFYKKQSESMFTIEEIINELDSFNISMNSMYENESVMSQSIPSQGNKELPYRNREKDKKNQSNVVYRFKYSTDKKLSGNSSNIDNKNILKTSNSCIFNNIKLKTIREAFKNEGYKGNSQVKKVNLYVNTKKNPFNKQYGKEECQVGNLNKNPFLTKKVNFKGETKENNDNSVNLTVFIKNSTLNEEKQTPKFKF